MQQRDKIRFANFTRYRVSRQSPCLHETLAHCSRNVKTSARTHTDRCTFFRYVFPPLALSISGAVEDLSSSQPVPQAPVVIIHYADFLLLERI